MKSNCVWAAGEMLLDKWTHGGVRVRQSVLRRASSDKKGGSSLYDLARGIARVTGIRLRYSPSYGDSMTWWQLLDRLDHGGGAVLIGEYGRLPSHYTRWEPAFARRRNSSHAVYIQSYDRVRGRVWLMDPLADGDFQGEWIAVETLHRFASFQHGKVMAAATPARHRPTAPPLVDHAYRLAGPRLSGTPVAGSTVTVQVGLAIRWGFPAPTPQRLTAHWVPVASPDPPDPPSRSRVVIDSARAPGALPPPDPVETMTASAPTRAGAAGFRTTLPVPTIPGRYRLSLGLAEVGRPDAVADVPDDRARGRPAVRGDDLDGPDRRGRRRFGGPDQARGHEHRDARLAPDRAGRRRSASGRAVASDDAGPHLALDGRRRRAGREAADRPRARPERPGSARVSSRRPMREPGRSRSTSPTRTTARCRRPDATSRR